MTTWGRISVLGKSASTFPGMKRCRIIGETWIFGTPPRTCAIRLAERILLGRFLTVIGHRCWWFELPRIGQAVAPGVLNFTILMGLKRTRTGIDFPRPGR